GVGVVLIGALGSGIFSAVLSGAGGGAGSVLESPGDSLAGAFSVTFSGVGRGTPETLPAILTLIPTFDPPVGDPQLAPKLGNMRGERITKVNSAMCNTIDAINQRSNLSSSNVIYFLPPFPFSKGCVTMLTFSMPASFKASRT